MPIQMEEELSTWTKFHQHMNIAMGLKTGVCSNEKRVAHTHMDSLLGGSSINTLLIALKFSFSDGF